MRFWSLVGSLALVAPLTLADYTQHHHGLSPNLNPLVPVDHDDPEKCLDIKCCKPITWKPNMEEVCKYWKTRSCKPKSRQVCINVPVTECDVHGYTDCTTNKNPKVLRDDKVVGAQFWEVQCPPVDVTVIEKKTKAECQDLTKRVCEKEWSDDNVTWVDVESTCKTLTWENCDPVPNDHEVKIKSCKCTERDIWYNKFEKSTTEVECPITTCEPKAYYKCKTTQIQKCTTVEWEECEDTCDQNCDKQHFRIPDQEFYHRRWCSHVKIELPNGKPDECEPSKIHNASPSYAPPAPAPAPAPVPYSPPTYTAPAAPPINTYQATQYQAPRAVHRQQHPGQRFSRSHHVPKPSTHWRGVGV